MATSGIYTYAINRDQIIRQALLNIGKISRYDTISPEVISDCALVLNMLTSQMMGNSDLSPGFKVWTRKRGHLFLSTQTGQYSVGPGATGWTNDYVYPTVAVAAAAAATVVTLSAVSGIQVNSKIGFVDVNGNLNWSVVSNVNTSTLAVTFAPALVAAVAVGGQVFSYVTTAQIPLAIESAVLRNQDLNDWPLNIMRTTQDYDNLPTKAQTTNSQDPTAIYFETQLNNSYIYIDAGSASDVTKHIVLTYFQPVQNFVHPTDEPFYPPEYNLTLTWELAKLIAPQFNRPWTQNMEDVVGRVSLIGRRKDPELTTLYFQPDAEN